MSASAPANGAEIKTFCEGLLNGETIDDDVFYALLNSEKDLVEGERNWEILKKLDSSQSASSAAKTLPTDFREPLGLIIGTTMRYLQVPFEQSKQFANSAYRWYLDLRNNVYYLLGPNLSGTINFFYKYQTDDITSTTGSVFGVKFNKMLAYRVASKFYDLDQEEKGLSYKSEWDQAAQIILNSLIDWDVRLQKRAVENGLAFDQDTELDIGLL